MAEELDKSGVIEALTTGIGAKLGGSARSSFYEMLDRLGKLHEFRSSPMVVQQHIIDILALSVIYTQIIIPLESGMGFLRHIQTAGATHIRRGNDKLDSRYNQKSSNCTRMYYILLNELQISVSILSFSTLKELTKNTTLILNSRES